MFENFDQVKEIIYLALNGNSQVKSLIADTDIDNWEKIYKSQTSFEKYLNASPVNLFTTLLLAGWCIKTEAEDQHSKYFVKVISTLENYLVSFPILTTNKIFKKKIKNLGGSSLLSTLSELSLAYKLKNAGLKISFEHPFINRTSNSRKDVDLVVGLQNGTSFYIEVYMPQELAEDGFFDPTNTGKLENKINLKIKDKFGFEGIEGISGKTFLAINQTYFEPEIIRSVFLDELGVGELDRKLLNGLPMNVDGCIFFSDNFESISSFIFNRMIYESSSQEG